MDIASLIISLLLIPAGIIGCLLPVLPGPPLSYIALLLICFSKYGDVPLATLIILGVVTLIIQILDYVVPVWGTKKFGGSKYGTWGSMIGLVAGLFFIPAIGPFGIITILGGPFAGAYIGEKIAGKTSQDAMRAAFGSFIGFLAGTFMKLACSLFLTVFYFIELVQYF